MLAEKNSGKAEPPLCHYHGIMIGGHDLRELLNNGAITQNGTHRERMEEEGVYKEFIKIRQQAESRQM